MNEHDWTRDYVATYLANGLDAEERSRLESHIGTCAPCAGVLDETRAFDMSLNQIFAPVRPDPTLEDRVIRGLRMGPTMTVSPLRRFWIKVGLGVAAVVTIGALGAVVSANLDEQDESVAVMRPKSEARRHRESTKNPMPGGAWSLGDRGETSNGPGENRKQLDAGAVPPSEQPAMFFAESNESDHNESMDGDDGHRMRGEPMDKAALAGKPYGGGGATGRAAGGAEGYSYRDELKTKTADAPNQYFQPALSGDAKKDLADRGKAVEKLEKREGELRRSGAPAPRPGNPPPVADPKMGNATTQGAQDPQPGQARKIIRNGQLEYEIENFDACVATVMKIVSEEKGYIATVNSEKLENGKVRGEIVLRCPPENLDTLVLKLRGIGDLKGQKITSEDVTKAFYDTDSKLRAARSMEARLLEIIKSGKGEIKDLLEAEKQLGVYRQQIEVMEGELRYLSNLVSLCTLKLQLIEKNIRTAASSTETETVSAGIEAEDVEKQYKAALDAIAELKGRVTGSEMKRYEAGQYQARITCEVTPENSGTLRDRLKQLGTVARLDVDRQVTTDGTGTPTTGTIKKNDSKFDISIYNIINLAPRETLQISIAVTDAEAVYAALVAKFKDEKSGGRVVSSNLNRQRGDRTTGFINFEVKADQADAALAAIKDAGEVMRLIGTENNDTRNVTKAKKGFQVGIFALGAVQPRETSTIYLAAKDVAAGYKTLQAEVAKVKGRVMLANLNEQNPQQLTAVVDFEIRREDEVAFLAAMKGAGEIYSRVSRRVEDNDNVIDSKIRMTVTLLDANNIPPRETWTITLEASDIDDAAKKAKALGRLVNESFHRDDNGSTNFVSIDVPLASSSGSLMQVKGLGRILTASQSKNPNIPEGAFAVARFNVTINTQPQLVGPDDSVWAQIKKGLGTSVRAIGLSIQVLIIGLIVVLPLGLLGLGAWKVAKKQKATTTT